MKMMILAAIAALSLGMTSANAETSMPSHQGDQFSFVRGGGG